MPNFFCVLLQTGQVNAFSTSVEGEALRSMARLGLPAALAEVRGVDLAAAAPVITLFLCGDFGIILGPVCTWL